MKIIKNNRGFSVIELVLSFVLVSILVIGMLTIALKYQESTTLSEVKLSLDNYKNTVTKAIQDDITKYGINNITSDGSTTITIVFKDNTSKQVIVNKSGKYIQYNNQIYKLPNGEFKEIMLSSKSNLYKAQIKINYPDFEDDEQYSINIVGMR